MELSVQCIYETGEGEGGGGVGGICLPFLSRSVTLRAHTFPTKTSRTPPLRNSTFSCTFCYFLCVLFYSP